MHQAEIVELREFLKALCLAAPAPARVPALLYQQAAQVLRSRDEAEDLLQDLVADLLLRTRRQQPGGVLELLKLDDGALLGALRRRLVQVAATSRGARWALVKQLRQHVRAALASPLPVAAAAPLSVTTADRVQGNLVALAVAAYLAQPGQRARDPKEIAAWVLAEYFPGPTAEDLFSGSDATACEHLETSLDAPRVAKDIQEHLGAGDSAIIARRATGADLNAIARERGTAVSTAHAHLAAATARLRARVKKACWSRCTVGAALGMLSAT